MPVDIAITLIVNQVKFLGVIFFIVCLNLYCFSLLFFDLCFRCRITVSNIRLAVMLSSMHDESIAKVVHSATDSEKKITGGDN